MSGTDGDKDRLKSRRLWAVFAVGAVLIAVPAGLWLGRISIAETAVKNYCSGKGVACSLSISRLGFNHIYATDIRLEKENTDPVSLDSLSIDVSWPELFKPVLTSLTADHPKLVVDTRNGKVSVDILESFQSGQSSSNSQTELPPFTIKNGELTIFTDAGPVKGNVNTSGSLGREVQSSLRLEPAELSLNGRALSLQEGQANFVLAQSRISGDATLKLASAELDTLTAKNIDVDLKIEPRDDSRYVVDWTIGMNEILNASLSLQNLTSRGVIGLSVDDTPSVESTTIVSAKASIVADAVNMDGHSVQNLNLIADLAQSNSGLAGPVSLKSGAFEVKDVLSASSGLLTGDLTLDDAHLKLPDGRFSGAVSLQNGQLAGGLQSSVTSSLSLPDPFDLHSDAFRKSLHGLMSNFNMGMELSAAFQAEPGQIDLTATRPLVIRTPDRSKVLSIKPSVQDDWLSLTSSTLQIIGDFQFADTQTGLSVSAPKATLRYGLVDGLIDVKARQLVLPEWRVDDRQLDIDLRAIRFRSGSGDGRFSTKGQFRYSGPAFGMELDRATLVGSFDGLETKEGWIVRLSDEDCFDFAMVSAVVADLEIGTLSTRFCAPSGVLYDYETGARGASKTLTGQLTSPPLELPLRHDAMTANVTINDPVIDWRSGEASQVVFSASSLQNVFRLTGENLEGPHRMDLTDLVATMDIAGGDTRLAIDASDIGLSMFSLPVAANAAEWKATGKLLEDGPDLTWTMLGMQITDQVNAENNALFEPMMTSGTGTLNSKEVTYSGRLRLTEKNADFGQLEVAHDILNNKGSATLSDGQITFVRGVLQPYDISERLRGIAVASTGSVSTSLKASWDQGNPSASAWLKLDDISFSSYRLGDFYGLSGEMEISDLINLRTPPGQKFTLQGLRLSPAVMLTEGEFSVQLINANLIHLEKVSWPFVDGTLSVDPGWWALDKTEQGLTVRAEKWSLSRLATLFDVPDLDVQGTVSGSFPIEVIGPNLYLRDARLDSVENGRIRYLGDVGSRAGDANEYAKMAFDALRDFDYKVLSIGANGNLQDEILLEMSISGRNTKVLEGQTFNLNISLQSKLAELIHGSSYATSTTATRDAVLNMVRNKPTDSDD